MESRSLSRTEVSLRPISLCGKRTERQPTPVGVSITPSPACPSIEDQAWRRFDYRTMRPDGKSHHLPERRLLRDSDRPRLPQADCLANRRNLPPPVCSASNPPRPMRLDSPPPIRARDCSALHSQRRITRSGSLSSSRVRRTLSGSRHKRACLVSRPSKTRERDSLARRNLLSLPVDCSARRRPSPRRDCSAQAIRRRNLPEACLVSRTRPTLRAALAGSARPKTKPKRSSRRLALAPRLRLPHRRLVNQRKAQLRHSGLVSSSSRSRTRPSRRPVSDSGPTLRTTRRERARDCLARPRNLSSRREDCLGPRRPTTRPNRAACLAARPHSLPPAADCLETRVVSPSAFWLVSY